jgi:hypothetical protein
MYIIHWIVFSPKSKFHVIGETLNQVIRRCILFKPYPKYSGFVAFPRRTIISQRPPDCGLSETASITYTCHAILHAAIQQTLSKGRLKNRSIEHKNCFKVISGWKISSYLFVLEQITQHEDLCHMYFQHRINWHHGVSSYLIFRTLVASTCWTECLWTEQWYHMFGKKDLSPCHPGQNGQTICIYLPVIQVRMVKQFAGVITASGTSVSFASRSCLGLLT